jgi:hypothetical protein
VTWDARDGERERALTNKRTNWVLAIIYGQYHDNKMRESQFTLSLF